MSYCRHNGEDSDVYVIATWNIKGQDALECFCEPTFFTTTRSVMIDHLREHQEKGDKVPDRTFERLEQEIAIHGDEMNDLDQAG